MTESVKVEVDEVLPGRLTTCYILVGSVRDNPGTVSYALSNEMIFLSRLSAVAA